MKRIQFILVMALTATFVSCSNDKKASELTQKVSVFKSDVLLQSTAYKPFSRQGENDSLILTVSGKTILEGTATFKAINAEGKEVHCESFPAKELIQTDYKTANSVLQEAHIREVVKGFFYLAKYKSS